MRRLNRRRWRAAVAAFARIAALDATLSDYKPDSELSRLTRDAVGRPIKVSRDLFRVLDAAQGLAARSDGAFDYHGWPAVPLWRRARRQVELPPPRPGGGTWTQPVQASDARREGADGICGTSRDASGRRRHREGICRDEALVFCVGWASSEPWSQSGGDLAIGRARRPRGLAGGADRSGAADTAPAARSRARRRHLYLRRRRAVGGDFRPTLLHIVNPKTGLGLTGIQSVTVVAGTQ
jgi:thiamine biosynthesis lipoprotein